MNEWKFDYVESSPHIIFFIYFFVVKISIAPSISKTCNINSGDNDISAILTKNGDVDSDENSENNDKII